MSTGELFSQELLAEIRERFVYVDWDPHSGSRIYLEASGGSLRLKSVVETMARETALPDELYRGNPGSEHAVAAVKRGLADVRTFLGATSGEIVPAISSSQAIFYVMSVIASHAQGSNMVTTAIEHPSNYDATRLFAKKTGRECRVTEVSRESGEVPVEAILEQVDEETCLLSIVHGSNVTGAVHDLPRIVEEARKIQPDLYVLADGVQYAPHGPIDVNQMGVDAYFFSPYKLHCVKGIGFAYVSDRVAGLSHWRFSGKPPTEWALGSPEHQTYAAWSAVVDYFCWLGRHFTGSDSRAIQIQTAKERIQLHMVGLLERLLDGTDSRPGLREMRHVSICGHKGRAANRLCIVPFNLDSMTAQEGVACYGRNFGVRVSARIRDAYSTHVLDALGLPHVIRLSACHYNTPDEIDVFLEATAALAK